MTAWWLAAACLVGAAVLLAWPSRRARKRHRRIMSRQPAPDQGWPTGSGMTDGTADRAPENRWWRTADRLLVSIPPWRSVLLVAVLVGVAGALVGGPVGAIGAATYAGLAARGLLRRRAGVVADRVHRRQLDELCALAADLRAGLSPSVAMLPAEASGRMVELARAAVRLAEQTGAPLADLIERIEADARAMDRGLAAAEAQAAGARATAWLLAGLPLGGIALGYGIGVDPLRILLYTPIGAACALGAIALQLAGLAWASRLSAGGSGTEPAGGGVTWAGGLGGGAGRAGGRGGGNVGRSAGGVGAGATWAA
ncbi:type II secretion system F family protein [Plantactinospora solaniradicis]|uniref:Type II secretion system F family protein n=1 Tax=Plantactinospora solaniradicis TaxID=1723736 RepID=A0ABW1KAM7_9ACTN